MFRRCISALVMAGYIAGQLATLPHAHGAATERHQHDATPHFHVGRPAAAEHHHHDHGTHHGHHHDHGCTPQPDTSPDRPIDSSLTATHPDSGAVYFLSGNGIAVANPSTTSPTSADFAATVAWTVFVPDRVLDERSYPLERPPDDPADDSSLYLTLRQLRI